MRPIASWETITVGLLIVALLSVLLTSIFGGRS
jgi:hypothetical protein